MTDWFGSFLKSQEKGVDVALLQAPFFDESNIQLEKSELENKEQVNDIKSTKDNSAEDLIKKLKDFRFVEAKKKNLPLYCIFANSVIEDIAVFLPTNKEDLLKIKGFGSKKSQQYGDEIINIISDFLKENPNFESKEIPSETKLKRKKEKNIELPKIEKQEEKELEFIEDENTLKIKEYIKNGENIFITGSAGTGKSFILNRIKKEFKIDVTSTTGMAAVNIGGQTIHAWAGVGICDLPLDFAIKNVIKKSNLAKRIREATILAIDEISMLDAQTFDYISAVLKAVRSSNKPFGGLQLILFGDFFQLPPVEKSSGFCFESATWKELNLKNIVLSKIYRQADGHFAQILNDIRQNKLRISDLNLIYSRNNLALPVDKEILHVFAINEAADNFNLQKFNALPSKEVLLIAKDILMKNEEANKLITSYEDVEELSNARRKIWDTLDKYCKVSQVITLKENCRVMLLKNLDFEEGLINGACGKVVDITSDGISVKFDNGSFKVIKQEEFDYVKDGKLLARRVQFPLRLAYGITIHKSQGMTLDEVFIDFNRIFEYGQAYVALSRVKSLDGLYLKGFNPQKIMANPRIVEFYKSIEA